MVTKVNKIAESAGVIPILRGTKQMEELLSSGYGGMTVASAKKIIAERKEDPRLWPLEREEEAQAFLAAYNAKPDNAVISKRPPWKRSEVKT